MANAWRQAASTIICAPQAHHRLPKQSQLFNVLLLKRNGRGSFENTHVFPGGVIDPFDHDDRWKDLALKDRDLNDLPSQIAAIRETFEECGIALYDPPLAKQDVRYWRQQVHQSGKEFIRMCELSRIHPRVNHLVPWATWSSPVHEKVRFDTKFYLTVLDGAEIEHAHEAEADGRETLSLQWLTPADALSAFRRKGSLDVTICLLLLTPALEIHLYPPQYYILTELSRMSLADAVLYVDGIKNRSSQQLQTKRPELVTLPSGSMALVLPGDPLHSTSKDEAVDPSDVHRLIIKKDKARFTSIDIQRRSQLNLHGETILEGELDREKQSQARL
ncbi:hypothetical protein DFS34DRAFT_691776 [Phlyctochytrium arcticum]|nr:hypothetical protein DFS34DRAFT_691776 [Phlyctochytrium arcticum]